MPPPAPAPASDTLSHADDLPGLALSPVEGFLRFAPVPVKARRDGWTPELQLRFVLALARGAGVDEAARRLGRTRQTAYSLRHRAGAESFAAAWDAAAEFAREARGAAAAMPLGAGHSAIETLLVPRFYRGRLIGFVQRENLRGAMARLKRLDRLADRIEARGEGEALRAISERLGPLLGKDDKGDAMRLPTHQLRQLWPVRRAGGRCQEVKTPRESL